jgi:hypothetical protein
MTNTVSGSIYMRDHELKPSRACEFGGWINQLSVSATDFAILAISISTLLVVRQKARLVHVSLLQTLLMVYSPHHKHDRYGLGRNETGQRKLVLDIEGTNRSAIWNDTRLPHGYHLRHSRNLFVYLVVCEPAL